MLFKRIEILACAIVISLFLGCIGTASQIITVKTEAMSIELVKSEPDRTKYKFIGDIQGEALSGDVGVSTLNARNDIKNKAYALGADIVVLDSLAAENTMDYTGRSRVYLTGRAFKLIN